MASESQKEELEVLQSIYDGDSNFRELESTKFQYKVSLMNCITKITTLRYQFFYFVYSMVMMGMLILFYWI